MKVLRKDTLDDVAELLPGCGGHWLELCKNGSYYEVHLWVWPWEETLGGEIHEKIFGDDFMKVIVNLADVNRRLGSIRREGGSFHTGPVGWDIEGIKTRKLADLFFDLFAAYVRIGVYGLKNLDERQRGPDSSIRLDIEGRLYAS